MSAVFLWLCKAGTVLYCLTMLVLTTHTALSASTATLLITNNKFPISSCCPLIEPKKFFEVLAKAGMSEGFQTFAFSFVS